MSENTRELSHQDTSDIGGGSGAYEVPCKIHIPSIMESYHNTFDGMSVPKLLCHVGDMGSK